MKRWIIFLHRYLGIPMSLVFVVWFVSGIVMMYTGDMPALDERDRREGRGAIDFAAIALSPAEAAARAGLDDGLTEADVYTLLGRPAYRFAGIFGATTTVFADTGEVFETATPDEARAEVAGFTGQPVEAVRFVETLYRADQWTLTLARELPLDYYDVVDGRGTRAYFSRTSGEVELVTDRGSRTLAWLGAIPHWFYFTPLRTNQPYWYWTVVWVSVAGCLIAALGIVLAFTQFRRSRPFRLSASIRYRGLMRWHYLTGAVFGVFALTWVFSGLMSMEPFGWTQTSGLALPPNDLGGGRLELGDYRLDEAGLARALDGDAAYEIELTRIQSEPYLIVTSGTGRYVLTADTLIPRRDPFAPAGIVSELERVLPDVGIESSTVLHDYDAYYYARGNAAPLPVLRVRFDDPDRTWYYFDLNTSRPVAANHRGSRVERWLFNGLHSLDFGFWYDRRPAWDIGLILLSLGALVTSGIGMYLGIRRLIGRAPTRAGS